jgi:hypothetical protein
MRAVHVESFAGRKIVHLCGGLIPIIIPMIPSIFDADCKSSDRSILVDTAQPALPPPLSTPAYTHPALPAHSLRPALVSPFSSPLLLDLEFSAKKARTSGEDGVGVMEEGTGEEIAGIRRAVERDTGEGTEEEGTEGETERMQGREKGREGEKEKLRRGIEEAEERGDSLLASVLLRKLKRLTKLQK